MRTLFSIPMLIVYLFSTSAAAYTNQWEWKVYAITYGATNYSVPTTAYITKSAAIAAMRAVTPPSGSPPPSILTVEDGIQSLSTSKVRYKFSAATQPAAIGAWRFNMTTITDPNSPYIYDSEAEMLSAFTDIYSGSCNCQATVTPISSWTDDPSPPAQSVSWYGDFDQNEKMFYRVEFSNGSPTEERYALRRRSYECPHTPIHYSQTTTFGVCANPLVGYIEGHPLECAEAGRSSKVGNPCDVATGDKSQTETDYAGTDLTFSRHYHSAVLESSHGLGVGWMHNFAARLSLNTAGTIPFGLLRPDGHHDILTLVSTGLYISRSGAGIKVVKNGSQWVASHSDGSKEIYDAIGSLVQMVDEAGRVTTLSYTNNRLASVVGPFGHRLQFTWVNGLLDTLTNPAGQATTYDYDANQNLVQVQYPDGASKIYLYENTSFPNHLTGITDENNVRFATYGYDTVGRVILSEHAGGAERVALAYNANNTSVTDAAGALTTYTFDGYGSHTRRITSVSKNGLTHSYVAGSTPGEEFVIIQRRITRVTDPRGLVTTYGYDLDHLLTATEAFGTPQARTRNYQYLSAEDDLVTYEGVSSAAGGLLRETLTTYNSYRLPAVVTQRGHNSDGTLTERITTYSYDTSRQLISIDGPRTDVNDVTTYTYYNCTVGAQCGQVQTMTNAAGHVTTYNTYNAHGQPLTITDPNGVVTILTYDPRQRLTSRRVGSEQTTFEYWPTGLLRRVTLPDASFLQYTYDAAHRLTGINDFAGNRIAYTLDAMGNRTAEQMFDPSNALKQTHSRVFNTLNQLWKEIGAAGTANVTTTFGYDNDGNQTSVNAPLGRNATQSYDELNRLTQLTDSASGLTRYAYDALDQIISVIDPKNLTTSYTYNNLGDVKAQVSPDMGTTTKTYDSGGNLKISTDARGKVATYSYDALNRVTQIAYGDQTIAYGYDAGTNGRGQLTSASDAGHSMSWTYDGQGRMRTKTQITGSSTRTMTYAYNSAGQRTSLTTPSGQLVTYGYTDNRITSIAVNGVSLLSNVLYDPFGPPRQWTWGNGTLAVRTYDQDGKVAQIDSAGLKTYSYDDAFRITRIADPNSIYTWNYGYDLLDRLTSASKIGTNIGYSYDANGNRLTQTGTTASTYAVAPTSNRLNSTSGSLTRTYTYDAAGNALSYGGNTLAYNNRGRLKSVTTSGGLNNYTYNALGELIKKSSSTFLGIYFHDDAGHLLGEYFGTGSLIQETIWLGDIPVATLRPKTGGVDIFYVHTDHLNTPRKITRPSDNGLRWRWDPDAFGNGVPNENPQALGLFPYNLRLPGQLYLPEAGLHYNYFRDYDPAVGRYVESDPIGLEGGMNTYGYVSQNPANFIDPAGLAERIAGWVECGPNSKLVPKRIRLSSLEEECGIGDCILEHERSHIDDFNGFNKSICRYVNPGIPMRMPERSADQSEAKAYEVSVECLKRKLNDKSCDEACKQVLQAHIAQAQRRRDHFRSRAHKGG